MRTSKSEKRLFRQLQRGDRLVVSDRREVLQKLLERIARFEVVNEVLHRHSRASENRSAALHLGI
jgi:hypothetical protein